MQAHADAFHIVFQRAVLQPSPQSTSDSYQDVNFQISPGYQQPGRFAEHHGPGVHQGRRAQRTLASTPGRTIPNGKQPLARSPGVAVSGCAQESSWQVHVSGSLGT